MSGMFNAFTVFHEASWQCPVAFSRLDGSFAEQYFIIVQRQSATNHARVNIVDVITGLAYMSRSIVALWNNINNVCCAALNTVFHGGILF
jgi:hypothetical protein